MRSITPRFFDLLGESDQTQYLKLKDDFHFKYTHNLMPTHQEVFSEIISYCIRNDDIDVIRCRVCGICITSTGIGVNYNQLNCLLPISMTDAQSLIISNGCDIAESKKSSALPIRSVFPEIDQEELSKWCHYKFKQSSLKGKQNCSSASSLPIYSLQLHKTDEPIDLCGERRSSLTDLFNDPLCLLPVFLAESMKEEKQKC